MTLSSCIHLVNHIFQLLYLGLKKFCNINCLSIFPHKSITYQSWPCHKLGQGQCPVMICTNNDVPPSPQCYIPSRKVTGPLVLEKKIFEGVLPYIGMAAILVMRPWPSEQTLVLLTLWSSIWDMASKGPVASEKKTFENVDRQQHLSDLEQRSKNDLDLKHLKFFISHLFNYICQILYLRLKYFPI